MDNLAVFYLIAFLLFGILGLLLYKEITDSIESRNNISFLDIRKNFDLESFDTEPESENETERPKEVFHLNENKFTYRDAKIACKAMNAELANVDQIADAYKKGANWCNYGWTDDQMALYPIQEEYFQKLQKNERLKNSCGLSGINGGYFVNTNLLFGANCYGAKPDPKEGEELPDIVDYETNSQDEQKYNEFVNNPSAVAPFNYDKWNEN